MSRRCLPMHRTLPANNLAPIMKEAPSWGLPKPYMVSLSLISFFISDSSLLTLDRADLLG